MAAATAFFAFFALPSIVILLSRVLGSLFNDHYQRISGQLFHELAELFGPRSANQLEDISQRLQLPKPDISFTALSILLVLVASTTLFTILKNSLNQLWRVKRKAGRNVLGAFTDRLVALAIIFGSGLLFSGSLVVEQLMNQLSNTLSLSSLSYYQGLANLSHLVVSILVRTVWFAILFKYLPDVNVAWRVVWPGAFFTSVLFKVGEGVLKNLLINSQVGAMYGRSGAIILLLLFVFYASLMFYYGASFTRQYSEWAHSTAPPTQSAIAYTITEVEPAEKKDN
ncbi:membrane protein [Spirosoma fluviale]|uniref:Membrane protein n=2 Tax=Spirosoma fluviale TaxID=1597977 RepID=A0A286GC04_9BACT|nr:membrane protein [Spirosoma fluviale]